MFAGVVLKPSIPLKLMAGLGELNDVAWGLAIFCAWRN